MTETTTTTATGEERIAVVVCHGMGQQVAFGTLSTVAAAVAKQLGIPEGDIRTQLVSNGDRYLARAELEVADGDAPRRSVHVYESYWAPLVEGKVTLVDTLRFLIEAGLTGARFALVHGEFDRWMFHNKQRFEIPARRVYQFLIATWVLALLAGAYATFAAAIVVGLGHVLGFSSPDGPHTADFLAASWTLVHTAINSALIGAAISMLWLLVLRVRGSSSRVHVAVNALTKARSRLALRVLSLLFALLLVFVQGVTAVNTHWPGSREWIFDGKPHARTGIMLVVLGALLYGLARFLVDNVGDVAAYISPFKVSKFQEIRSAIQAVGRSVSQHVYMSLDENGKPLYDGIYFVGHSLGSLVAYDSLDDALARDARIGGWDKGSPVGSQDVVGRTRLLLTFGSPLDKTAFIFRTQGNADFSVRERVAARVQPLIFDRANREHLRWVNLWSRFDWISGSLEFYDEGERLSRARIAAGTDVRNVHVRAGIFPWSAHTSYWKTNVMPAVLARAITGNTPAHTDAVTAAALTEAFH